MLDLQKTAEIGGSFDKKIRFDGLELFSGLEGIGGEHRKSDGTDRDIGFRAVGGEDIIREIAHIKEFFFWRQGLARS